MFYAGEIENDAYAKFLVPNKVYYGQCGNGEWPEE